MTNALDDLLDAGSRGYWDLEGLNCCITLEPRPSYCDRGNWIAKLHADPILSIDHADLWPRYYFYFLAAKIECEAWLQKRKQQKDGAHWEHHPIS